MVTNTLELCQCVTSADEHEQSKLRTLSDDDLIRLTSVIGIRAFKAMWLLEGVVDAETEFENNKKKGSRMKKPTYLGIGARIRDYKKDVSGSGTARIYNAVVLEVDASLVNWDA